VTNLKMRRRDMQIGLIKALGGGFDATQTGLVVPAGASASPAEQAAPAAQATPATPPAQATRTTQAAATAAN
jgi:hypothetical protein